MPQGALGDTNRQTTLTLVELAIVASYDGRDFASNEYGMQVMDELQGEVFAVVTQRETRVAEEIHK